VKANAGFTLTELLLAVAVMAVLVSVGVPGFKTAMNDARQVTVYNKVSSSLRFARSEAIKRSKAVTICARATDTTCGSDWTNGMLVFQDSASDGSALVYDGTDKIIRVDSLSTADSTIVFNALLASDASTPTATNVIRFNGRGRPNWLNGTIVFCDRRGVIEAKALIVTGSGIVRRAYSTDDSNGVVVDARGSAVSCS